MGVQPLALRNGDNIVAGAAERLLRIQIKLVFFHKIVHGQRQKNRAVPLVGRTWFGPA